MTRQDFIDFIRNLGFVQSWQTNPDKFYLNTDRMTNMFQDALHLTINDNMFHLSISQMSNYIITGKSFGQFNLTTFAEPGDIQIEIFISFIKGSFNNTPVQILQFMRDSKIKDILK